MKNYSVMIEYIILSSLISAFILNLSYKWGVIEWLQVYGNNFFHKMSLCNFCLSWWVNCIIAIILFVFTFDLRVLAVPFFSTMITRKLL